MPKRVELQDKGKIRGIRRRWLLNSIGVLALIMVLLWATFAVSLWTYYSYTITADLSARAELAANTFKSYTRSEYQIAAQNYISNFEDRSKLEVQFIDTTGAVLFSGYGLTAGTTPGTPDITDALEQRTPQVWPGRDPATKEPIMAASAPVIYQGTIVGVIRFVTSMSEVNRQFILGVTVVTLIMALFKAAEEFARVEGILPAPESSHAIKAAVDEAMRCKETGEEKTILFGLTGTGYFDMVAYERFNNGQMSDYIPTDEELAKGFAGIPSFAGNDVC